MTSPPPSEQPIRIGRLFFAVGPLAWGLQHFIWGAFVTRVVPTWPAALPVKASAYAIGAVLTAIGAAMTFQIRPRLAALMFAGIALASFVLLYIPLVAADGLLGGSWTSAGKSLVMFSASLLVAHSYDAGRGRHVAVGLAATCLGVFMILCGIQHFMYVAFVVSLIPSWIPGAVFWTYFAAVALIAGGIGLMVPRLSRLAAWLSGAMIFSWVFLVHVPLTLRQPADGGAVASVFEALAFSGVAFMIAGYSYRSAVIGSTAVARLAGRTAAASATVVSTSDMPR